MSRPETTPTEQRVRSVLAIRTAVFAALALGVVVASAASGKVAAVLVVAGVIGLIGGACAVLRGRSEVFSIRSRRGAAAVLAVSLGGLFVGGAAIGAPVLPESAGQHSAGSAAVTLLDPAKAHATKAPTALALLATLRVKGRAPMTGYVRKAKFGAPWLDVDRNGCDTRDDILRRDLSDVAGGTCKVTSGVLHDPYTAKTIHFVRGPGTSAAVQIDHIVPLADAWRTGAQRLSQAQRIDLANDPINLLAVDGPTNERKGDGDAATWLPKQKSFRCTYVAHQVGVKHAYGLWVTKAEAAAMRRVLAACPTMRAPVSKVSHVVFPGASSRPSAAPTASATATAEPTATASPLPSATSTAGTTTGGTVSPGAYCSDADATGRTAAGTEMTCRTSPTDERLRWRKTA